MSFYRIAVSAILSHPKDYMKCTDNNPSAITEVSEDIDLVDLQHALPNPV